MKELMIRDMRKLMILVVMVAAFALPTMAQSAPEWQTSTMKGSGSNYAPQVTPIGAASVASEATTTESYTPGNPGAIRRNYGDLFDTGADTGQSTESPIGDALLPLLLMAMVYGVGCTVYRRKHPRTLKADN